MENLNSIYTLFNDKLDQHEKAINEVNKQAADTIRKMVLDKNNYTEPLYDTDMDRVAAIFTNMVYIMERSENIMYINHCAIVSNVMDALFFKGDFELLDILRSSEPFSLLSDDTKNEIKAILSLIEIYDASQSLFFGNTLYQFSKTNELPPRETICSLNRKYEGLASQLQDNQN